MTPSKNILHAKAYFAMQTLIDYCRYSECYSCIFRDFCEGIHLGRYTDLHDAACSSLDYIPNEIALRYAELVGEGK